MDPLAPNAIQVNPQQISGNDNQYLGEPDFQIQYLESLSTNNEQTYTQLSQFYGNRQDLNDLADLLNSWNLGDYIHFFQSKYAKNSIFYIFFISFIEHLCTIYFGNINLIITVAYRTTPLRWCFKTFIKRYGENSFSKY